MRKTGRITEHQTIKACQSLLKTTQNLHSMRTWICPWELLYRSTSKCNVYPIKERQEGQESQQKQKKEKANLEGNTHTKKKVF